MQQSIINESVLEQIVRQERQVLKMVAMKPKDRPEYLRSTAASRQSMSQSGLFRKLTVKEKRFVDILFTMSEPNQTQAYIQAGYKSRGATAMAEASKVIRKPKVAAYLAKLKAGATKRAEKTADDIIRELEGLGFAELTKEGLVKAGDKLRALEALGKRFGIFPNNANVNIGATESFIKALSEAVKV